MANLKATCKQCKTRLLKSEMIKVNLAYFCCFDHAVEFGKAKARVEKENAARKQYKADKEGLATRTELYDKLQVLVNQWVRYRDRNEPCCTCGTTNDIKYDAGHCFTRAARSDIRFELTNIHKQCSVNCNQHGSGMRAEYKEFIIDKYGKDHLDWLECAINHKSLKEKFPHKDDINTEIDKFRKMLRDVGIKPNR